MSETETPDEQRAADARAVIQAVAEQQDPRFAAQLQKLPPRILAAGLGQALAFLHARGDAPALVAALDRWLLKRRPKGATESESLLERIIYGNAEFQRYATAEVLAYLAWLVRFADGQERTQDVQGG
jgi:CRISPR-associated protein Cmr5